MLLAAEEGNLLVCWHVTSAKATLQINTVGSHRRGQQSWPAPRQDKVAQRAHAVEEGLQSSLLV